MNLQRAEDVGGLLVGGQFAFKRAPPPPTMPLQITLGGRNLRGAHSPSEDGLRDKRVAAGVLSPRARTRAANDGAVVGHYRTDARW